MSLCLQKSIFVFGLVLLSSCGGGGDSGSSSSSGGTLNTTGCVAASVSVGGSGLSFNHTGSANSHLGQSFQITSSTAVTKIQLYLKREGTSTLVGNVYVTLAGDVGGSPNSSALVTSDTINASSISNTQVGLYTFTVSSTTLNANTTYWVVLTGSYTGDASNYIKWQGSGGDTYSLGEAKAKSSSTSTWSSQSDDLVFKVGCP